MQRRDRCVSGCLCHWRQRTSSGSTEALSSYVGCALPCACSGPAQRAAPCTHSSASRGAGARQSGKQQQALRWSGTTTTAISLCGTHFSDGERQEHVCLRLLVPGVNIQQCGAAYFGAALLQRPPLGSLQRYGKPTGISARRVRASRVPAVIRVSDTSRHGGMSVPWMGVHVQWRLHAHAKLHLLAGSGC